MAAYASRSCCESLAEGSLFANAIGPPGDVAPDIFDRDTIV